MRVWFGDHSISENCQLCQHERNSMSLFDYEPARGESTVQNRCCIVLKEHTHLVHCLKIKFWIQSLAVVTAESAVICCAACYVPQLFLPNATRLNDFRADSVSRKLKYIGYLYIKKVLLRSILKTGSNNFNRHLNHFRLSDFQVIRPSDSHVLWRHMWCLVYSTVTHMRPSPGLQCTGHANHIV